jgi:hypothetical protein
MKTLLVAGFLLLFGGCRLAVVKESDMFYLKHDVSELQVEVSRLKREVRDLSRGFSVVPITVTFTNMTADALMKEGN